MLESKQSETKSRVLIIDDDPITVEILTANLALEYEVLAATDANVGLEIAKAELPDIILLDVVMPNSSGFDVCRKLKNDDRTKDIPVIFSTAKNSEADELQGLKLGAVDYVHKPFSMPLLSARLTSHVNLKKKADLLERLVSVDGVTEIHNRRYFDRMYEKEWRRAERAKLPMSICFVDIDFFKQYNDTYGHGAGDKCLYRVAQNLKQHIRREGDFVARYGGEEFVCVWIGAEADDAIQLAQNLRYGVASLYIPHRMSECAPHVTISMGVASTHPSQQDHSPESLLKLADERLYQAKNLGRNMVYAGEA